MRVLFFGTAEFAVPSLEALLDDRRFEILAVVTQPDKPQGRGQRMVFSPVKRAALQAGLNVLQPRRVRSAAFLEQARSLQPDVLALAAFGQIIPQPLLDLPPLGPINVHGSLLPAYRGAAPIQHALLNGETTTGVTTMWMEAALDTGDILLQREIPIEPDDTTGTLTPKLAAIGAQLLVETLILRERGACPRVPQDHSRATYAPAVTPDDSRIRWEESAQRICNRIRALSPRPGVFAAFRGKGIKLWRVQVESETTGEPGQVVAVTRDGVTVGTGGGVVTLREVQPESGRRMAASDWARGARVSVGDRLQL
jgi:methionyl-tRNA formyltransferase